MSIKVLIIEDDKLFSWTLETMFQELNNYEVMTTCRDAETALAYLEKGNEINLIIADIMLNGEMNGIEFAKKICAKHIPIVFITKWHDEKHYEETIDIPHHTFVVKPFHKYTLDAAIRLLLSTIKPIECKEETKITPLIYVRIGAKQEIIDPKTILWVESKRNYCTIHTDKKEYTVKRSLKNLYEQLQPEQFVFIHKSFMVRLCLIKKVDIKSLSVQVGDKAFPLGRTYIKGLRSHLIQIG